MPYMENKQLNRDDSLLGIVAYFLMQKITATINQTKPFLSDTSAGADRRYFSDFVHLIVFGKIKVEQREGARKVKWKG